VAGSLNRVNNRSVLTSRSVCADGRRVLPHHFQPVPGTVCHICDTLVRQSCSYNPHASAANLSEALPGPVSHPPHRDRHRRLLAGELGWPTDKLIGVSKGRTQAGKPGNRRTPCLAQLLSYALTGRGSLRCPQLLRRRLATRCQAPPTTRDAVRRSVVEDVFPARGALLSGRRYAS